MPLSPSRSGRVALASGVIIVLVALFISFVPSPSRRDGSAASPPPRPSPTAETIALWPVQMPPGEYGAIVDRLPITFRVPDNGWFSGLDAGSLYFRDDPIHGWMRFWAPDQVYAHPCQHTLMGPIGPSAADLADAMASIPGISSSGVRDTVVGGLPAKHPPGNRPQFVIKQRQELPSRVGVTVTNAVHQNRRLTMIIRRHEFENTAGFMQAKAALLNVCLPQPVLAGILRRHRRWL